MKQLSLAHRHFALSVAALALAMGIAADSRAATVYGYSTQTISNLQILPTGSIAIQTPPGVTTFAQDGTTFNGSGASNSNALDPAQAYQGAGAGPPPNTFGRFAPGDPPISPVGNFTRGDALIAANLTSSSVVAESYLSAVTANAATASAGLGASFNFTPTVTALTITYDWANRLFVYSDGPGGTASADYHFGITIRDTTNSNPQTNVVFNFASTNTNLSLSAPPPSGEIIKNGTDNTGSITGLVVGRLYSITFSSTAQTSLTTSSVIPEPASVVLMGIGGVVVLGMHFRRRKAIA